jgi:5'-AMP-activated protein kinase, catalytic alpha subunit
MARQHAWFQQDLPPYLQHPPEVVQKEVRQLTPWFFRLLAILLRDFACHPTQIFKIDEEVFEKCLSLKSASTIDRDQLIAILHRLESHPLRVAYDLILDHKNAKIRVDGMSPLLLTSDHVRTGRVLTFRFCRL